MKLVSTILGIALATTLGMGLSMFVLVGSQGMDDRTPILPMLAAYVPMLALAQGLGAALGLIPVVGTRGGRAWLFSVGGFTAGGAIAGLLFCLSMMMPKEDGPLRSLAIGAYFLATLTPLTAGIFGLLRGSTRPE